MATEISSAPSAIDSLQSANQGQANQAIERTRELKNEENIQAAREAEKKSREPDPNQRSGTNVDEFV